MNRNRQLFVGLMMSVVILSWQSPAQDEEEDASSKLAPIGSAQAYTYSNTEDALKVLEEILAANEAVLKNQEATLVALDQLGERATSARASAAAGARKK
jgi:hypothetical protein